MAETTDVPSHFLEFVRAQMWKGELHFCSRRGTTEVATVRITQLVHHDSLRIDWQDITVTQLDRRTFSLWLHAALTIDTAPVDPFTADTVTWTRNGPTLHVAINGIDHVFPTIAVGHLRMLAVR